MDKSTRVCPKEGVGMSKHSQNTIPIWDHRQKIGEAKNEEHAKRKIAGTFQNIPKGWKITVRERDTNLIDLPAGYIFSIHP